MHVDFYGYTRRGNKKTILQENSRPDKSVDARRGHLIFFSIVVREGYRNEGEYRLPSRVVSGRIINSLNKASSSLGVKGILQFIDYDLTENEVKRQYDNYISDCLLIIAEGKQIEQGFFFKETRRQLHGITERIDNRSAEDIINDTFEAHGITVVKKQ